MLANRRQPPRMRCTICQHEDPTASFGAQCPEDQSYLVDDDSYREGRGDPRSGG